jgi:hypothetical protein
LTVSFGEETTDGNHATRHLGEPLRDLVGDGMEALTERVDELADELSIEDDSKKDFIELLKGAAKPETSELSERARKLASRIISQKARLVVDVEVERRA